MKNNLQKKSLVKRIFFLRQAQERARDTTKTKTSVLENGGNAPENEDHFGSSLNRVVNPQRRRLSISFPSVGSATY